MMEDIAVDIYAETNPAFCALTLGAFCESFQKCDKRGADFPLVYIALPICLSTELADSFQGTNKSTGFLTWLERSPKVLSGFPERVGGSLSVTTEAIRFGAVFRIIELTESSRIIYKSDGLKKKIKLEPENRAHDAIRRAGRFGHWLGEMKSTQVIFNMLGVSI